MARCLPSGDKRGSLNLLDCTKALIGISGSAALAGTALEKVRPSAIAGKKRNDMNFSPESGSWAHTTDMHDPSGAYATVGNREYEKLFIPAIRSYLRRWLLQTGIKHNRRWSRRAMMPSLANLVMGSATK